jgi:capsular polysaccharide biosynthesis protein
VNEDDVIAALTRMDFRSVQLESMPLKQQIGLFQNAEVIVAPHGAGLANLVYAQPGCKLIELHTDSYVNWCTRRIAAVCGVEYDCVIGRHVASAAAPPVHAQQWIVSPTHVLSAVEQALART